MCFQIIFFLGLKTVAYCLLVLLSLTSCLLFEGRQMIEHTKKLVEDKFTILGGYEHNAEVCHHELQCVM